ncbi:MAG: hypothetical protein ACJAY5_001455 [Actinomycetes bacterium]|jgi:hypothetical protein
MIGAKVLDGTTGDCARKSVQGSPYCGAAGAIDIGPDIALELA